MGGGGGGARTSLGDISSLVDKAKEELRRAEGRRNVFLSFAFEDVDEVNLLRGQSKNERSDIEFNDWSVREPFDSTRADYIRQKIGERITQSSLTVVYLSESTVASRWVEWEIEESIKRGKEVIAVHKGDVPPTRIPEIITQKKIKIIQWSKLANELKVD